MIEWMYIVIWTMNDSKIPNASQNGIVFSIFSVTSHFTGTQFISFYLSLFLSESSNIYFSCIYTDSHKNKADDVTEENTRVFPIRNE